MHQSYEIEGRRFGIRTTSREFGEWIRYALGAYRTRRKEDPYFSVVVGGSGKAAKVGAKEFHVLYRDIGVTTRSLDLAFVGKSLLLEIETLFFPDRDDAVYAGAGIVALDGVRALIPSNLLLYVGALGRKVERAGIMLPASNYVAIDPDAGRVQPIQPTLDIPPDALDRLAEISPQGRPDKRTAVLAPVEVARIVTQGAPRDTLVQPVSKAFALHRMSATVANLSKMGRTALEALAHVVDSADCLALGPTTSAEGALQAMEMALNPSRKALALVKS